MLENKVLLPAGRPPEYGFRQVFNNRIFLLQSSMHLM
jgi:hypothetical protein